MSLGLRIKELRQKKNIPVDTIASQLGMTRQGYYNWEAGKSNPSIDIVVKLSKIFDVDVKEIVNHSPENPTSLIRDTDVYWKDIATEKEKMIQLLEREILYLKEKYDAVLVKS